MKRAVVLLVSIILKAKSGIAKLPCPSPNERCDCEGALEGYVTCQGLDSLPQNLPITVAFLDLESNPIGSALLKIQMKNLQNLTLKQLYLGKTGLKAIESRVFLTQTKIKTLDLSRNSFKRLDGQIFYGLVELSELFLTQSSIYEISPTVFVYTPALKFLDLAGNMLTKISTEFSSLSNLRTLLLSDNKISSIEEDALDSQSYLNRLMLYGNRLQTPEKKLFENVVANNGSLELNFRSAKNNPWKCCGQSAADYREFVDSLPVHLNTRQQYDIVCSMPEKFFSERIGDLDYDELEATKCQMTTTKVVFKTVTNSTPNFKETNEEKESMTAEPNAILPGQTNMFNNLTNGHIVVILLAAILIAVIITATVVHCYHARSSSNGFDEFVSNLPNSGGADSDDEAALTTKTYRHDAPVYGSTGKIVDRHMNGMSPNAMANEYLYDVPRHRSDPSSFDSDSGPEVTYDIPRPVEKQKRKPPPYNPASTSPEHEGQQTYEQTQFNNSSSVGLYYKDLSATRRNPFDNMGYDSDISDDLWNASTCK